MLSVVSILSASLLVSSPPLTAQDTSLWRYTTTEKIEFYRVTPLGDLIVGTKEEIVSLNPETGEVQWTRSDIQKLPTEGFNAIPFTPYSVVRSKDGIALLDLATGETLWDSTVVPLKKVRGYLLVPQHDMLLVYGETPVSKRAFVAVELTTGEVRWGQDTLLQENPKLQRGHGIHSFAGHQPPLLDSDTTFILNISKDGPLRIDSRTGELLWRADLDKNPPLLREGYAPMTYDSGVLFVAYEKGYWNDSEKRDNKLLALNTTDGSVIWDREETFPSRVIQMELTPHGLVVRGQRPPGERYRRHQPFIDLVDPETGLSLWEQPERGGNQFVVEEDAIFLPGVMVGQSTNNQLPDLAGALVSLAFDGSSQVIAVIQFERTDDLPDEIEKAGTSFFLSSGQAFASVNRAGTVAYHRYYEAPEKGLFEPSYAPPPSRQAEHWANFAYVYTKQPDSSGREGFSLVKLDKRDGQEVGRVWMLKKRPDYVLDRMSGFVFIKVDDKEIIAHKFPGS